MRLACTLALAAAVACSTAFADEPCKAPQIADAVRALDEATTALSAVPASPALEKALRELAAARARLGEASAPAKPRESAAKIAGLGVLSQLAGLWSGPLTTQTSAGNFPLMNIDFRAVDDRALFGRSDLDGDNSIRLLLNVERQGGEDQLVFRSRGLFFGFIRDTRAKLEEERPDERLWRFCSMKGGCRHVEARFHFPAPDRLVLDVKTFGKTHLHWTARRAETRRVPAVFPADLRPVGSGDSLFPALPRLRVRVTWAKPLAADADVWVVLSETDCHAGGGCTVSRSFRAKAKAGATHADALMKQIHPGEYRANAILDRNRNWLESFRADKGDGVAHPNTAVRVAAAGESTGELRIFYEMP
jgi:hypothetical protein